MALHDHFQDAITRAHQATYQANAGALDASTQLHHVVTGPRGSGKTTAAEKYVVALVAEGLAIEQKTARLDCGAAPDKKAFQNALWDARGGVLLLDNAHKLARDYNGYDPIALIKNAMEGRHNVFIFVGETAGLELLIRSEPGLQRRLNTPVHMPRRLRDDEIAAYQAAEAELVRRANLSTAERDAEDASRAEAAAWKQLQRVETASNAHIRPMKTVRFTRKDHGA